MNRLHWERNKIWQGCILSSLAHAIMVAHYPQLSHEQSWDGFNYNVQDSSGAKGTVTFHSDYCAATFCSFHSNRIHTYKNAMEYFQASPKKVQELAMNETLQYLWEDMNGDTVPIITTAVWSIGNEIYSKDTCNEMMENGGFLLERQATDLELAIKEWQEYYEMTNTQVYLLRSIFQRKIEQPSRTIVLSEKEVLMIESEDEEGLSESKISFEEMGIKWEA